MGMCFMNENQRCTEVRPLTMALCGNTACTPSLHGIEMPLTIAQAESWLGFSLHAASVYLNPNYLHLHVIH